MQKFVHFCLYRYWCLNSSVFQTQLVKADQKIEAVSIEMEKMKEEFKSKQESFVVLDECYKVGSLVVQFFYYNANLVA